VLIDQPSENRPQRDGGQARSPRSFDYENLRDASPADGRRASSESAGDDRYYDSGPARGAYTESQSGPGSYRGPLDNQANLPAPHSRRDDPSRSNPYDARLPSLDSKGSSINGPELDDNRDNGYHGRYSRGAAETGREPATTNPKYGLPLPGSKHPRDGEPGNFNTDPLSEFKNCDMTDDDDRVTMTFLANV
jgi:hypothetical protein